MLRSVWLQLAEEVSLLKEVHGGHSRTPAIKTQLNEGVLDSAGGVSPVSLFCPSEVGSRTSIFEHR